MLVLLSSGSRERYLDDIVRCLALPPQTEIQFRYSKSWLSNSVLAKIERGEIRKQRAIICYIDQSTNGTIYIVPCRMAQIIDVTTLGSSFAIQIQLDDLPATRSFANVRQSLSENQDCPRWDGAKVVGRWFFDQPGLELTTEPLSNLIAWEEIVKDLLTRNDFTQKKRDFFFHVLGITAVANGNNIIPVENKYRLSPAVEYELALYHYHPNSDPSSAKSVSLVSSSKSVALFSLERTRVNSRYDLKSWQFTCEGGLRAIPLTFEIRTSPSGEEKDDVVQIDLRGSVSVDWNSAVIKVFVIAGGLSLSSLAALAAANKLSVPTAAVAVLGSIIAAVATIWKTK